MTENNYIQTKSYFGLTIDPLHVGSGGSRLGRVDNPIIRDPGTKIPKVPGSSINGPARYYTALRSDKLNCAGKSGDNGKQHCGSFDCNVCIPYGFSTQLNSLQGLAHFFDAHIVLFPVASMVGPIWVTSPNSLSLLDIPSDDYEINDTYLPIGSELIETKELNFGWLLLKNEIKSEDNNNGSVGKKAIKNEDKSSNENLLDACEAIPKEIRSRAVLVDDNLFSKIVNMNLEVRTSVSINPVTGAAEEGALFTYEAIPRTTVLKFDILYKSGKSFKINENSLKDFTLNKIKKHVESGLSYFQQMGIGGMNTRGMGRLKILNLEDKEIEKS